MYSIFYQKYMDWMPRLGGYKAPVLRDKPEATHLVKDKSAINFGNEYRGVGVLIGFLGIAIVFAAIAPGAFQLENIWVLRGFGMLKVFMMCLMLTLVYIVGQKSGLKEKWIDSRRDNEKDRYKPLHELIQSLESKKTEQLASHVKQELSRNLLGETGQIHYNHYKAEQYEAIERAAERISWVGFFIALLSAVWILLAEFDLVHHHYWLILGTAFLPALVGGVHGINGFLTVGNLAGDHKTMAVFLREASAALKKVLANDKDEVLNIAKMTYLRLDGRDAEWKEKTQSGNRLIVG